MGALAGCVWELGLGVVVLSVLKKGALSVSVFGVANQSVEYIHYVCHKLSA